MTRGPFHFQGGGDFRTFRDQLRGSTAGALQNVGRNLYVEGTSPVGFHFDEKQFVEVRAYLLLLARAGRRVVVSELNRIAFTWLRIIQAHVPVDIGLLRQSYNVAPATMAQGDEPEAAVGTNVPYAVYIEFGTRWIARGAVMRWQFGQPPILDWPAKRADASKHTVVRITADGQGVNASGRTTSARAVARAEWMPPMRHGWVVIKDQVLARLRERLIKELASGRIKI